MTKGGIRWNKLPRDVATDLGEQQTPFVTSLGLGYLDFSRYFFFFFFKGKNLRMTALISGEFIGRLETHDRVVFLC